MDHAAGAPGNLNDSRATLLHVRMKEFAGIFPNPDKPEQSLSFPPPPGGGMKFAIFRIFSFISGLTGGWERYLTWQIILLNRIKGSHACGPII